MSKPTRINARPLLQENTQRSLINTSEIRVNKTLCDHTEAMAWTCTGILRTRTRHTAVDKPAAVQTQASVYLPPSASALSSIKRNGRIYFGLARTAPNAYSSRMVTDTHSSTPW